MINNGASSNRVDMIFIGDGYQAFEIETTYDGHVSATVDSFFNSGLNPLPRYQNFFNVHRVNVISNESGADDPANSFVVDTALDATYNTGGTDRCLYFDTGKANIAVNTALAGTAPIRRYCISAAMCRTRCWSWGTIRSIRLWPMP